jgi:transcriptional regulator with XRE-family HTH domain/energy-coupling factor transporter ATP-binding protein EcfA2
MYDNNVPFHIILKKERKRRGWSQAYVAEKLGTDFRVVSRWERGLHLPTAYHRPALCALFNMSAQELRLVDAQEEAAIEIAPIAVQEREVLETSAIVLSDNEQAPLRHELQQRDTESLPTFFPTPRRLELPQQQEAVVENQQTSRQRLLAKVRSFWISDVLERSLHGAALLTPGLEEYGGAVVRPWRMLLHPQENTPHPLPAGTRIIDVYDQAEGELLILGEPGSGKTTLLLELARVLLDRACASETHPMPVVFNLSSWAEKRLPLTSWFVEELSMRYQVPRKLGELWVAQDALLPLLDGLDEMTSPHCAACIEAINSYRQDHGLFPLVVCSRSADYLALPGRLKLRQAVVLQPLRREQVDEYLGSAGHKLQAVSNALHYDPTLQELATTPLMLSMITQAYQERSAEDLLRFSTPEIRRQRIFSTYTECMLTRRPTGASYTKQQTMFWLSYLAIQMKRHSQAVFSLEQLQPDWLPQDLLCHVYDCIAVRCAGAFIGFLVGLLVACFVPMTNFTFPSTFPYGAVDLLVGALCGWLVSSSNLADMVGPRKTPTNLSENPAPGQPSFQCRDLPRGGLGERRPTNAGFRISSVRVFRGAEAGVVGLLVLCFVWLLCGPIYGFFFGLNAVFLCLAYQHRLFFWKSDNNGRNGIRHMTTQRAILRGSLLFGTSYGVCYILSTTCTVLLGRWLPLSPSPVEQLSSISDVLFLALLSGMISALVSMVLLEKGRLIQPTELVVWSWHRVWHSITVSKHLLNALLIGLSIGAVIGLTSGIFYSDPLVSGFSCGLSVGISVGLSYVLLLGLFRGVSSEALSKEQRVVPNQGMTHSLRNSILLGFIGGSICMGVYALDLLLYQGMRVTLFSLPQALAASAHPWSVLLALSYAIQQGWSSALFTAQSIWWTAPIVGAAAGLLIGLIGGGLAWIQHWLLRFLLWKSGVIPWNYAHFLDYAAEHILLRKVGGSYIFIHQLLLDYFTQQAITTPPGEAEQIEKIYAVRQRAV